MLAAHLWAPQRGALVAHRRQKSTACRATNSSNTDFGRTAAQFQRTASKKAQEFQKSAQEFVNDAGKKVAETIEEQQLSDKAQKAMNTAQSKLQDIYAEAQDNARRTFWKIDSEHRINEKARKARRRVEQAATDFDQQYKVKSTLRTVTEDVQRQWPAWKRRAQEFFATTPGKLLVAVGIGLLFSTGAIWPIINLLLVLWWLSVPLSLFSITVAQRQQQEAFRRAAQQQQQARQRQQANPFAGFTGFGAQQGGRGFGGFGGFGGARPQQQQQQQGWGRQGDGPVIDAEYTVIDDDDGGSSGRKRK